VDPECCTDDDCPNGECINGSCVDGCQEECCSNTDCTATDCSTCVSNACVDPECCTDDDCPNGQCIDGSCVDACQEECCSNTDCIATDCSTCENNACVDPECCTDDDCPNGECINGSCVDGCQEECCSNTDCTATDCSTCVSNACVDPECCTDDDCLDGQCIDNKCEKCEEECCSDADCPAGQTCVDGICKEPCTADGDCTGTECSTCENNWCKDPECCNNEDCQNTPNLQCSICNGDNTCSQPQCCVDADCTEPGYICVGNACVPEGECNANKPCGGQNSLCDITTTPHGDCEWCDLVNHECKPGCDSGDNCPSEKPICSKPDHQCNSPGTNGVESITIVTDTCSSCAGSGNPTGLVEGGVSLQLDGLYNTHCNSNGLDNGELVDYDNGKTAVFDGTPPDDGSDDGLAGCKLADLNEEVSGGSATWTGDGVWTGAESDPICVKFSSEGDDNVTCCCKLESRTLQTGVSTNLIDCKCTKN